MSNSYSAITIYRGRTKYLPVSFGYDISQDTFVSQIREKPNSSSALITTWTSSFATDGTDGELILMIDDSVTAGITVDKGYMDIKRIVGGEPVPAHNGVIHVIFEDTVTA